MITHENRAEANENVPRDIRYQQIIEILDGKELTAREVAWEMAKRGYVPEFDPNHARPRLTELSRFGRVEPCGTRQCKYTGRNVTVYKIRDKYAMPFKIELKEALKLKDMTYQTLASLLSDKGTPINKGDLSKMYYGIYEPPNYISREIERILDLRPFSLVKGKTTRIKGKNRCNAK